MILLLVLFISLRFNTSQRKTSDQIENTNSSLDLEVVEPIAHNGVKTLEVTESNGTVFSTPKDLLPSGNKVGGGYAVEMSPDILLKETNIYRNKNKLASLSINPLLSLSAQNKAEDMSTKDYWSHTAPDGLEPWFFINEVSYNYVRAGENLAYGFRTSDGVINGWVNSPSHRANILGDYKEVGFGIINAENYLKSGHQTIIVAHYGAR